MRTILLSMLLLLGACATVPADAPPYARAPEPADGLSNVYIYRIGAYPLVRAPMVSIDGRAVVSPAEGAYTVVALAPGPHEMHVNWPWDTDWPDLKFTIEVEASRPLYLKISGSSEPIPGGRLAGSSTERVSQAAAEREMAKCCRYIPPRD